MRVVTLLIIGFGSVGRGLLKLITSKYEELKRKYNIELKIVGLADSSGFIINEQGFTSRELLKILELPRSSLAKSGFGKTYSTLRDVLQVIKPDIVVELTPCNYDSGEPGYTHIKLSLEHYCHVVTANKAPLVLYFNELKDLARSRNLMLLYKATVMGGTPLLDIISIGLKGQFIKRIEGILNATTNYILTRAFEGLKMSEAINEAKKLGIMEANPSLDLDGIDAAAKLVIIANTLGLNLKLSQVERVSLMVVSDDYIEKCRSEDKVIKYIAMLSVEERKAKVAPEVLSKDHPLANISGTLNSVKIETETNTIVITGKGGGGIETAGNVLSDILIITEHL